MIKIQFVLALLLISATCFLAGCGELNLSGRDALLLHQQVIDDNPDADKTFGCVTDFNRLHGTFNGREKDVIVIEVDRDCIIEVIEDKKEDDNE